MTDPAEPLSPYEWDVLADRTFLPAKARAAAHIEWLLDALRTDILTELHTCGEAAALLTHPGKISRGENYRQFAFRVLDAPARMAGQDLVMFRTVVVFGHPVGFHLILAGAWLQYLAPRLADQPGALLADWVRCEQPTPWIWEPDPEHQVPVGAQILPDDWRGRDFLKWSVYLPLNRYREIPAKGVQYWQVWQRLLFGIKVLE
ncbi:MAG: hypothetical protein SF053_16455 [Bacteroidia bacterium]|nr:hypothetical protein [Bacteroidia bacterium]